MRKIYTKKMKGGNTGIAKGNCNIPKPDCFNKNGLPQLGVNPYNQPPTLSELAFDGRYCCGNGSASQSGGKYKKTKNLKKNRKKKTKKRKAKKGGGGYYLKLNECPIKGMPIIGSYNTCCPPIYDGELLKGGSFIKKKKFKNVKGGEFKTNCSNFSGNMYQREFNCVSSNVKPNCI